MALVGVLKMRSRGLLQSRVLLPRGVDDAAKENFGMQTSARARKAH